MRVGSRVKILPPPPGRNDPTTGQRGTITAIYNWPGEHSVQVKLDGSIALYLYRRDSVELCDDPNDLLRASSKPAP
jgi:hypothetical protein